MKKIILSLCILFFGVSQVFAYSIKLYDQWGNRIGTYKKEGENYILYDFYDKKIENPEDLIKNAPSQRTLKEYTQYFYDANFVPIGSFSTGLWSNSGRYYPRGGRYLPRCFYQSPSPYIVRPAQKSTIRIESYPYTNHLKTNYQRTGITTLR